MLDTPSTVPAVIHPPPRRITVGHFFNLSRATCRTSTARVWLEIIDNVNITLLYEL